MFDCESKLNNKKISKFISPMTLIKEINIQNNQNYSLFLDIDGTLADFSLDPNHSFVKQKNLSIIKELLKFNISVNIVTGRPLEQAQRFFSPLKLTIAATHGLEIFFEKNNVFQENNAVFDAQTLKKINQDIDQRCALYPQIRIEHKPHSVALHYREYPDYKNQAMNILTHIQLKYPDFKIITGKYVFELVPIQANKGLAIKKIIQQQRLDSTFPIFIGDDLTDEAGFAVINHLAGMSIKVGLGETQAAFRLENTEAVTHFLELFYEYIQHIGQIKFQNKNNGAL